MNRPTPENYSRDQLHSHQTTRLQEMLQYLQGRNPFWTTRFQQAGFAAEDLKSLEDLQNLPLLTKHELVENQISNLPYGTNLSEPKSAYTRLHQTSGTTGKPYRCLDTAASWNWFMECWHQIYRIIGLTSEDVLCCPFSFGPFVGFWAGFEGAAAFDALRIAAGGLSSEARLQLIQDHQATVLCCTPTYALRLAEVARQCGIDAAQSSVEKIVVAGEPGGSVPAIREKIQQTWGARVFDHWGMTEMGSLGIESPEDPASLLMLEAECIAEILDPQTHQPVATGELGELVVTNLGRWGAPVIRYRTGDLVRAATTPNACGRSLLRLEGGILGRADDMLTIRGNNVFPSSVEAVLREFEEIVEFQVLISERKEMLHLTIEIEPRPELEAGMIDPFLKKLHRTIKDRLNFQAELKIVEPESLPRFELKGRRFHRV